MFKDAKYFMLTVLPIMIKNGAGEILVSFANRTYYYARGWLPAPLFVLHRPPMLLFSNKFRRVSVTDCFRNRRFSAGYSQESTQLELPANSLVACGLL